MGPKREPKWSLKASQDGAKKEKKNEAKLSKVSSGKKGVKGGKGRVPTRPLGEGRGDKRGQDAPKIAPRGPKTPQRSP